jgi:hypothetical protein
VCGKSFVWLILQLGLKVTQISANSSLGFDSSMNLSHVTSFLQFYIRGDFIWT